METLRAPDWCTELGPGPPREGTFDPRRANTKESGLERTTAVGAYPSGASPTGAMDMAGNVWEWCLNVYEQPKRVHGDSKAPRALRGGSWFSLLDGAAFAFRNGARPGDRIGLFGFRVSCASPIVNG